MRFLIGLFTFLALATASVAQDYVLQPGDVLSVEVVEDPSLNRNVLVLPDGQITFPFAGTIRAANRSLTQVQANLRTALAPNFATSPTVFVSLASLAEAGLAELEDADLIDVYFLGEVNAPGLQQFDPGVSFLQALSQAGGFTPFAAKRRIQLRRIDPATGQEAIFQFDFRAVGRGAAISGNSTLVDGDVILVPERRLFE